MSILNYLKSWLRKLFISLRIDITENIKTDRLTKQALQTLLTPTSNCIDIGAHKGEILEMFLSMAPEGRHTAFEPLPHLYQELKRKYSNVVQVFPFALSDVSETTTFQHVTNAEAYSGIRERAYDIKQPKVTVINVETRTLDELNVQSVDVIKIDVEGAEYPVLKGGYQTIKRYRPTIIFEFGKGASEYYNTTPEMIYSLLSQDYQYDIYNLPSFLSQGVPYDLSSFIDCFESNSHYYFIARPQPD